MAARRETLERRQRPVLPTTCNPVIRTFAYHRHADIDSLYSSFDNSCSLAWHRRTESMIIMISQQHHPPVWLIHSGTTYPNLALPARHAGRCHMFPGRFLRLRRLSRRTRFLRRAGHVCGSRCPCLSFIPMLFFSCPFWLVGTPSPFSRAAGGIDRQPGPRMLSTMAPVSRRVWRKFIFPRAIQRRCDRNRSDFCLGR